MIKSLHRTSGDLSLGFGKPKQDSTHLTNRPPEAQHQPHIFLHVWNRTCKPPDCASLKLCLLNDWLTQTGKSVHCKSFIIATEFILVGEGFLQCPSAFISSSTSSSTSVICLLLQLNRNSRSNLAVVPTVKFYRIHFAEIHQYCNRIHNAIQQDRWR